MQNTFKCNRGIKKKGFHLMKLKSIAALVIILICLIPCKKHYVNETIKAMDVESENTNEKQTNNNHKEKYLYVNSPVCVENKEKTENNKKHCIEHLLVKVIIKLQPRIEYDEAKEIAYLTYKFTKMKNLDPYWVLAIMYEESRFQDTVVSNHGAVGLMQLMPSTAKSMGVNPNQLKNKELNIKAGINYISYLTSIYKDRKLVITAYNYGQGNVNSGKFNYSYYNKVKKTYDRIISVIPNSIVPKL